MAPASQGSLTQHSHKDPKQNRHIYCTCLYSVGCGFMLYFELSVKMGVFRPLSWIAPNQINLITLSKIRSISASLRIM